VVLVEGLLRFTEVGVVFGADRPRHLQHRVEPGADPAGLRGGVTGPLELADLAHRGLVDLLGQLGGLDTGAVVRRAVGLVLTELLADRGQLLPQQELALRLLQALADVGVDALGDLLLGEVLAHPPGQQLQPLRDVFGRQELDLLLQREPRCVAGRVGQLGQVGHPLDRVDHLPSTALLQDAREPAPAPSRRARAPRSASPRPTAPHPDPARPTRCGPGPRRGPVPPARRWAAGPPSGSSRRCRRIRTRRLFVARPGPWPPRSCPPGPHRRRPASWRPGAPGRPCRAEERRR
jgi:hypothetical protein